MRAFEMPLSHSRMSLTQHLCCFRSPDRAIPGSNPTGEALGAVAH